MGWPEYLDWLAHSETPEERELEKLKDFAQLVREMRRFQITLNVMLEYTVELEKKVDAACAEILDDETQKPQQ